MVDINAWEHLQDLYMKTYNKDVREEFSDVTADDTSPNSSTPRQSLKRACLIQENDTVPIALARAIYYYFVLRKARDIHLPVYGIPMMDVQESRKFKPQCFLYFLEDYQDVDDGFSPVAGEISFRVMNHDSESITESYLKSLANQVKSEFGIGSGFVWKKGKTNIAYTDKDNGLQLRILCRSMAEGERVVKAVLSLTNTAFERDRVSEVNNANPTSAYPTVPGTIRILGKTRKRPRKRPVADVRFQYALLHVHGLPNPICLLDRTGTFRNPLINP